MKVIINESRLDYLIRSYIKKELGEFIPSSGGGHPDYVGGFFSDVEDEKPIAYIKGYTLGVLYVDLSFIETLTSLFSIPNILNTKNPILDILIEVSQELVNKYNIIINDIEIFF